MGIFDDVNLPEDSSCKWPWPNPTPHAEVCPVCNGAGVIDECRVTGLPVTTKITCHGCHGTGWITVS